MRALAALLSGGAVAVLVGLPGSAATRLPAVLPVVPPVAEDRRAREAPGRGVAVRAPAPGRPVLGVRARRTAALAAPARRAAALGTAALGVVALVVVALVVAARLLGVVAVLLLAVAGAGLAAGRQRQLEARARELERRRAVEAVGALAGELRAGRDAAEALEVAAEIACGAARSALAAAAGAARWGADVPAVLRGSAAASAVPELLAGLAACWQVCSTAGSGLAAGVDRLAGAARARREQERAVAAVLAGPRTSAGLLAVLPLGGVLLAAGLGAHPVHVLLHTPLGVGCLLAGLSLDGAGLWWTSRLVSRARRAGR